MPDAPGAVHAVQLLTLLARHPEPLPAAVISRTLGLPRSSTYRLLAVLSTLGFVTHLAEERRYGLGVAVYELGSAYQRQAPLQRIARPILERLAVSTTQNAHLAVLHGRDVLYVIEERAAGRPLLVTDVGVRLPAPLTASGLAMLAALPSRQLSALFPNRSALVQRDGHGPATVTELRRALSDVRNRGYALEEGSITGGLSSVAHAVRDHIGHPVAGIAVTFSSAEATREEVRELVAAVGQAAELLSRRLGGGTAHRGGNASLQG